MCGQFPKIDELVLNTKKIFLKVPSRINLFKAEAPSISLSPMSHGFLLQCIIANICKLFGMKYRNRNPKTPFQSSKINFQTSS